MNVMQVVILLGNNYTEGNNEEDVIGFVPDQRDENNMEYLGRSLSRVRISHQLPEEYVAEDTLEPWYYHSSWLISLKEVIE